MHACLPAPTPKAHRNNTIALPLVPMFLHIIDVAVCLKKKEE
jgi:hypothetical protein